VGKKLPDLSRQWLRGFDLMFQITLALASFAQEIVTHPGAAAHNLARPREFHSFGQ
jgi:hypothetical protein